MIAVLFCGKQAVLINTFDAEGRFCGSKKVPSRKNDPTCFMASTLLLDDKMGKSALYISPDFFSTVKKANTEGKGF